MIEKFKLIPIVREKTMDSAIKKIDKIIGLGFKVIEITFTTPNADKIIMKIKNKNSNIFIGAGTISSLEEAKRAHENGADFLVSPFFVEEVNKFSQSKNILYIPGAMTINEIFYIKSRGCNFIKLFPASAFKKEYIKQIRSVVPNIKIMATGGIKVDQLESWFSEDLNCIGIGNNLFSGSKEELEKYV